MGCTTSNGPSASPESLKIEAGLKEDKKALNRTFKVLLLGAGDSGKSTFLKQICLVHKRAFPDYDVKRQSTEIRQYLVAAAKLLATHANRSSIKKENLGHLDFLISGEEPNLLDRRYSASILALMNDHAFSDLVQPESRISLNLDTNLPYFLQEKVVERVLQDGFLPTIEDMLAFRVKTTGVRQEQFVNETEKTTIQIIDVGGQKSERKKWMNQFDSVDLVIYFSSLDGYSLELHECDGNRLDDDLQLFKSLMTEVPQKKFWLFMQTKYDVLEKTLTVSPITNVYPEIPAEKSKDATYVSKFLQDKFNEIFDGQKIVFFTANMLVTDQLGVVWDTIRKDLMAGLLKAYV